MQLKGKASPRQATAGSAHPERGRVGGDAESDDHARAQPRSAPSDTPPLPSLPSEFPFVDPGQSRVQLPPCPVPLPLVDPQPPTTDLLELPGLVLVGPLEEVQQDDIAEDGALAGQ